MERLLTVQCTQNAITLKLHKIFIGINIFYFSTINVLLKKNTNIAELTVIVCRTQNMLLDMFVLAVVFTVPHPSGNGEGGG